MLKLVRLCKWNLLKQSWTLNQDAAIPMYCKNIKSLLLNQKADYLETLYVIKGTRRFYQMVTLGDFDSFAERSAVVPYSFIRDDA